MGKQDGEHHAVYPQNFVEVGDGVFSFYNEGTLLGYKGTSLANSSTELSS